MKVVDQPRLLGNYGESYVASLLAARGCFVRPVAGGTDIGIDLYCETTTVDPADPDGRLTPFLHFWVQVKSGAQVKVRDGVAQYAFDLKDLEYWYRQPIPVFVALVETEWPPLAHPTVWVIDIGTELVCDGPPQMGRTYRTTKAMTSESPDGLAYLLERQLPAATAMQGCKLGVLMNQPTIAPQYVGITPQMPAAEYSRQIAYQIRITSTNAIISMWRAGHLGYSALGTYRSLLASVVEACARHDEKRHWECYFAMGLAAHVGQRFDEAQRLYQEAKDTILADANKGSDARWSRHMRELAELVDAAREGRGVSAPDASEH